MTDTAPTFADLAQQFATAVANGRNATASIPFVALQYQALMEHKAETDDDKREITKQAAELLAYTLNRVSKPEYNGRFTGGKALVAPLFDALQAPGCIPFVPAETAAKIADACVALAHNGPALLAKAGPDDASDDAALSRQQNREELLDLTRRTLAFVDKCKEFRENLNLDAKTSKDIAPARRITLKAAETQP